MKVLIGANYKHYKGEIYFIRNIALLEKDHTPMVVYSAINDPLIIWVRPLSEFEEKFTLINEQ